MSNYNKYQTGSTLDFKSQTPAHTASLMIRDTHFIRALKGADDFNRALIRESLAVALPFHGCHEAAPRLLLSMLATLDSSA
jgi:HEAT repeat protein